MNLFLPPDGAIAPIHAQVDSADDRHLIRAAMGEVRVNGNPVGEHWLADNDVVELGTYRFRYRNRLSPPSGPAGTSTTSPVVMPSTTPPSAPASNGKLVLVDPMGGTHVLQQGSTIVGRESGLGISLHWEGTVSRRHAEITMGPNGFIVTDLGSSNGTFINSVAVKSATPLNPGDELRLGRCVLRAQ
jgi:pSer/pThr/pTyr-binding forkhead associated (FHA) protein